MLHIYTLYIFLLAYSKAALQSKTCYENLQEMSANKKSIESERLTEKIFEQLEKMEKKTRKLLKLKKESKLASMSHDDSQQLNSFDPNLQALAQLGSAGNIPKLPFYVQEAIAQEVTLPGDEDENELKNMNKKLKRSRNIRIVDRQKIAKLCSNAVKVKMTKRDINQEASGEVNVPVVAFRGDALITNDEENSSLNEENESADDDSVSTGDFVENIGTGESPTEFDRKEIFVKNVAPSTIASQDSFQPYEPQGENIESNSENFENDKYDVPSYVLNDVISKDNGNNELQSDHGIKQDFEEDSGREQEPNSYSGNYVRNSMSDEGYASEPNQNNGAIEDNRFSLVENDDSVSQSEGISSWLNKSDQHLNQNVDYYHNDDHHIDDYHVDDVDSENNPSNQNYTENKKTADQVKKGDQVKKVDLNENQIQSNRNIEDIESDLAQSNFIEVYRNIPLNEIYRSIPMSEANNLNEVVSLLPFVTRFKTNNSVIENEIVEEGEGSSVEENDADLDFSAQDASDEINVNRYKKTEKIDEMQPNKDNDNSSQILQEKKKVFPGKMLEKHVIKNVLGSKIGNGRASSSEYNGSFSVLNKFHTGNLSFVNANGTRVNTSKETSSEATKPWPFKVVHQTKIKNQQIDLEVGHLNSNVHKNKNKNEKSNKTKKVLNKIKKLKKNQSKKKLLKKKHNKKKLLKKKHNKKQNKKNTNHKSKKKMEKKKKSSNERGGNVQSVKETFKEKDFNTTKSQLKKQKNKNSNNTLEKGKEEHTKSEEKHKKEKDSSTKDIYTKHNTTNKKNKEIKKKVKAKSGTMSKLKSIEKSKNKTQATKEEEKSINLGKLILEKSGKRKKEKSDNSPKYSHINKKEYRINPNVKKTNEDKRERALPTTIKNVSDGPPHKRNFQKTVLHKPQESRVLKGDQMLVEQTKKHSEIKKNVKTIRKSKQTGFQSISKKETKKENNKKNNEVRNRAIITQPDPDAYFKNAISILDRETRKLNNNIQIVHDKSNKGMLLSHGSQHVLPIYSTIKHLKKQAVAPQDNLLKKLDDEATKLYKWANDAMKNI